MSGNETKPTDQHVGAFLTRPGKHKIGKSCLYVNKLADIDLDIMAQLIRVVLDDLGAHWPVLLR